MDRIVCGYFDKATDSMSLVTPCEIEILFGSKNRADFDALSDVDYLIADSDHRRLAGRKLVLEYAGFSVSDYTLARLRSLFGKQTLFAAHLKYEGRVIFDQKFLFQDLASGLNPNRDYQVEFEHGRKLFSPLDRVPNNRAGHMWALDHLAVAVRNLAIVDHARRGEFVFSHEQLVENYADWGEITPDELVALKRLREAKKAYRDGRAIADSESILTAAIKVTETLFRPEMDCHFLRPQSCLASAKVAPNSTEAYVNLREIERELVSASCRNSDQESARARQDLFRLIRDPHAYLWRMIHDSSRIARELEAFRAVSY